MNGLLLNFLRAYIEIKLDELVRGPAGCNENCVSLVLEITEAIGWLKFWLVAYESEHTTVASAHRMFRISGGQPAYFRPSILVKASKDNDIGVYRYRNGISGPKVWSRPIFRDFPRRFVRVG